MQAQMQDSTIDRVERLQSLSRLGEDEWLDLLQLNWRDYRRFLFGERTLSESALDRLSAFFNIDATQILTGGIDFEQIANRFQTFLKDFPEEFMRGAHGRRRTTITSLEFMEKKYGWRLKNDILRNFNVDPAALRDPFAPVSIRFISDACHLLARRQFHMNDFFEMGLYSHEGNINSLLARELQKMSSLEELYERFFNEFIFLYENNCTYSYKTRSKNTGLLTCKSNPTVSEELNVKHVGNEFTCELKRGMWASLPRYMGYSDAKVSHIQCEHRGDDACLSLIDLSVCRPLSGLPQ